MRRLKRPNKRSVQLAAWSRLAVDERAHNVREGRKKKRRSFKFARYKHAAVKAALQAMCEGKCAYCESRFLSTSDAHVEHYRPKGAVAGVKGHPGYYWLAAEWSNLLWSCGKCNTIRVYTFNTDAGRQRLSLGKGNRFPVRGTHATRPGGESRERRLLLHPCRDDPSKLLTFDQRTGVVSARRGCTSAQRKLVDESIRIYALNRPDLVRERRAQARLILDQKQRLKDCRRRIRSFERAGLMVEAAEERATLKKERKVMDGYLDGKEPFLLLASQLTGRKLPG